MFPQSEANVSPIPFQLISIVTVGGDLGLSNATWDGLEGGVKTDNRDKRKRENPKSASILMPKTSLTRLRN